MESSHLSNDVNVKNIMSFSNQELRQYEDHNRIDEKGFDENKSIFLEIQYHLLEDKCPSNYLNELSRGKVFQSTPFSMLNKLKDTMQSPVHHPEGNAWNHTMLVIDQAAKVRDKSLNKEVFMWAALLHDIGKPATTKFRKGRIVSYDHDVVGADLTRDFLEYFSLEKEFTEKVVSLVRWHMQILYVVKNLPFARISEMKAQVDVDELALLSLCDRLGRTNADYRKEEENSKLFLKICKKTI